MFKSRVIGASTPVSYVEADIKKWCNLCWKHLSANRYSLGWLIDTPFYNYDNTTGAMSHTKNLTHKTNGQISAIDSHQENLANNRGKDHKLTSIYHDFRLDDYMLSDDSFIYFMGDIMSCGDIGLYRRGNTSTGCPITIWGQKQATHSHRNNHYMIDVTTDCKEETQCSEYREIKEKILSSCNGYIDTSEPQKAIGKMRNITDNQSKLYEDTLTDVLDILCFKYPANGYKSVSLPALSHNIFSEDMRCLAKTITRIDDNKIDDREYLDGFIARQIIRWGLAHSWLTVENRKYYLDTSEAKKSIFMKEKIVSCLDANANLPKWGEVIDMCVEWYAFLPQIITNMIFAEKTLRYNKTKEGR